MSDIKHLPNYIQQLVKERGITKDKLDSVFMERVAEHHAFLNGRIECLLGFVQSIDDDIDKIQEKNIQEDSKEHFGKIKCMLDEVLVNLSTVEDYRMVCARIRIIIEDIALLIYCIKNNSEFRENFYTFRKEIKKGISTYQESSEEEILRNLTEAIKNYEKKVHGMNKNLQNKAHIFLEKNFKDINQEMKDLKEGVNAYTHGYFAPYSQSGLREFKNEMGHLLSSNWVLLCYTLRNEAPGLLSVFKCLSEILHSKKDAGE